jgi:hypothetical protein
MGQKERITVQYRPTSMPYLSLVPLFRFTFRDLHNGLLIAHYQIDEAQSISIWQNVGMRSANPTGKEVFSRKIRPENGQLNSGR